MNPWQFQPAAYAYCVAAGLNPYDNLPLVDEFGNQTVATRQDIVAQEMYHMALKLQAMQQAGLA